MATFAAPAAVGTVLDDFLTPERSQQIVRRLREQQASFQPQTLVCRGLAMGAGEAATPIPQRLRRRRSPALDAWLDDDLAYAFRRGIGQVMPRARRASRKALSAFALESGATLRLDLAGGPSSATDVILTFVCRSGGGAEAALRVWCRPWTARGGPRAPNSVALREVALTEGQAALIPAQWPAELVPRSPSAGHSGPLFALVVLVGVEARVETS